MAARADDDAVDMVRRGVVEQGAGGVGIFLHMDAQLFRAQAERMRPVAQPDPGGGLLAGAARPERVRKASRREA